MKGFRRKRGRFVAEIDPGEATILARVVADTGLLFGVTFGDEEPELTDRLASLAWSQTEIVAPSDPALARLLPNATRGDEEVNREFRRLTEIELREVKTQRLRNLWEALDACTGTVEVSVDKAADWAAALTDVRLVIASRLGIENDEDADRVYQRAEILNEGSSSSAEEIDAALAALYSALSWLQESLMQVMLPTLGTTRRA